MSRDDEPISQQRLEHFFPGDSEMAARMRAFDWGSTELGHPDTWPANLRGMVRLCLTTRFPIFIGWGEQVRVMWNDGYSVFLSRDKRMHGLMQPGARFWSELWDQVGPMMHGVRSGGQATWAQDAEFFIERELSLEEIYVTFSYAPILAADGRTVDGIFCPCFETTAQVLAARRLDTLRRLGIRARQQHTVRAACQAAAAVFESNPRDVPFAAIYVTDADGTRAELTGIVQSAAPHCLPRSVSIDDPDGGSPWPLAAALRERRAIEISDLLARGLTLPGGPWPEPVSSALVIPTQGAPEQLSGLLVVGVSPRRPLDAAYRTFFELVAGHIATTIADAQAHEVEGQRVEALDQLDQAKTLFFSNVSHEFRTPLTLILASVEDLGRRVPTDALENRSLEVLRRNALRLQKLVNALLDFSRVEAGRTQASFEPVDLAQLTRELVSSFGSAIDRAGLQSRLDCPPLGEPVYVDRELWEKIVLNLMSNALKFTLEGEVSISLRLDGGEVRMSVRDTGVGIPASEVTRVFERFHRVLGGRGRSVEGSGIGLALTQELVKLHGGRIEVASKVGQGSQFTVVLPRGCAHLPRDRIAASITQRSTATPALAFLEETLQWLPRENDGPERESPSAPALVVAQDSTERILVVDDNSDMRDYIVRLLAAHYRVIAVADGEQALACARTERPDLIVSDVMMPGLNGLELLRLLRVDPRTATIPLVLLSARAGAEASIEALNAGADDYIVKPFSARELLARVGARLEIARKAAEHEARGLEARFRTMVDSAPILTWVTDVTGKIKFVNQTYLEFFGVSRAAIADFSWRETVHVEDREAYLRRFQEAVAGKRSLLARCRVRRHDGTWRWIETRGNPELDGEQLIAFVGCSFDITELVESQQALEEADRRKDEFLAMLAHELRNPLASIMSGSRLLRGASFPRLELSRTRDMIERETRQLARLVDDLLDVSRITRGRIALRKERVDLRSVVSRALETVQPVIDRHRHRLSISLSGEPLWVDGDAARLIQVLSNLLHNAAAYTPERGEVRVVASAEEHGGALICVEDNGIGLSADDLPRIFQLFESGEGARRSSGNGLGIGLTLARRLVELHGGTLEAASAGPNRGSQFRIRLPLVSAPPAVPLSYVPSAASLASLRFLLVDDNQSFAEAMSGLLLSMGHEVCSIREGGSALAHASSFKPHVVLLDIGLPDMPGYEVARAMRADPQLAKLKIIAMTGFGREQDKRAAKAAGVDYHLTKPIDEAVLVSLLENVNTDVS